MYSNTALLTLPRVGQAQVDQLLLDGRVERLGHRVVETDPGALDRRASGVTVYGSGRGLPGSSRSPGKPPGAFAVRMGLSCVRNLGAEAAERIAAGRPYIDMADLVRRAGLRTAQVEALATAGAFDCLGLDRRAALWAAGAAAQARPDRLEGLLMGVEAPPLPGMSPIEQAMADLWATSVSPNSYPTQFARPRLDALGVVPAARLASHEPGRRVVVGGVVTHRQRPATAGGITFLNLEDETGLVNIICHTGVWNRYRRIARESAALLVRGRLERTDGVTNILAEQFARLDLSLRAASRGIARLPLTINDGVQWLSRTRRFARHLSSGSASPAIHSIETEHQHPRQPARLVAVRSVRQR
jgi:error-prone DNA polymerase